MTDEELDTARAAEARRQSSKYPHEEWADPVVVAARLAREGWTPPDPLEAEIESVVAEHEKSIGLSVNRLGHRLVRKALERGIEIGKAPQSIGTCYRPD